MKYLLKTVALAIIVMSAGCAVSATATSDEDLIGRMMHRQPSPAMYGYGRAPIPARPPVVQFSSALGPPAPFSDNVFHLEVVNNVAVYGEKDLILTRLWVGGVEKPLLKFVKIFDHVFPVRYLDYRVHDQVNLPPCYQLDGSGQCQVRVVAQASSWRYGPNGIKIPSANVVCIERTVSALEGVADLSWNWRINSSTVTCPEQGVAMK